MSDEQPELLPIIDERPAPLDALPLPPLPDDGSGVVVFTLNVYEFDLADGRTGGVNVYSGPVDPEARYASIWQGGSEGETASIWADPRLLEIWARTGFQRPEQHYAPIDAEEERELLARYEAADSQARGEAWSYWKEVRERREGGVRLRLTTSAVSYDSDDMFELHEYTEDETALRTLFFSSYDQANGFMTVSERQSEARRKAEREAAIAAGLPDPADLPPF
jgi:hypothetical protein